MSQFSETHLPCEACGSSDARSVYKSGVSLCFSCGDIQAPEGKGAIKIKDGVPFVEDLEFTDLGKRKLYEDTCRRYGYARGKFKGKTVQVAPYYNAKGQLVAQKIRDSKKNFCVSGDAKQMGLFGLQLARQGGKMIVITEGEIDAMSVSQAMGNTWPAVSLPNGASNLQALKDNIEFLESYEKVIVAFDNDEPGQKATEAALELFSPGKAFLLDLGTYKDANDMLTNGGQQLLRAAVWEAKTYRPDGIVNLAELKDEIKSPLAHGISYPWPKLDEMLKGFRKQEVVTWTAGTGVGKTALVSEVVYHLLTKEKLRVGVIYLEEGVARAGKRLVGIALNKPLHLPGVEYTDDEFEAAWAETLGTERAFAYDHFGSLDSDTLLNRIRFLVKGHGCDVVVLDHISMVVSGSDLDADERRMLDRIMTQVRSLTQETGASIHVVSHLRRTSSSQSHEEGGAVSLSHLRGTQAIAQLSDAVIAAERNQQAEDIGERNTTQLRVLKNRYAGITGPADALIYNIETGRLTTTDIEIEGTDFGEGDY